jgi:hypothetical protein
MPNTYCKILAVLGWWILSSVRVLRLDCRIKPAPTLSVLPRRGVRRRLIYNLSSDQALCLGYFRRKTVPRANAGSIPLNQPYTENAT